MVQDVKAVVELLKTAKDEADELLKNDEHIRILVRTSLEKLLGRLLYTVGGADESQSEQREPPRPLTHILGRPVAMPTVVNPDRAAQPSADDMNALGTLTATATQELPGMLPSDAKTRFGDLVLRAVGAKLGLPVTPTEPEKIDAAFVRQLQDALKAKASQPKSEAEVLAELDKIMAGDEKQKEQRFEKEGALLKEQQDEKQNASPKENAVVKNDKPAKAPKTA